MGSNAIIVREYLESLKEDGELDYLFPILLNTMGFRIVTTAKESKGQPQYGKDIIAIGFDEDRVKKRFYFELKGYSDKDIDDTVLNKKDGIIDSLKAARFTPFKDSSIPGFNLLPVKYVLVHNGVLKSNTRATFEGFISEVFSEGNFDRWDIYKLSDLFNTHLFGEYLFTDDESLRLFKKTLVLLDAPDYDFVDFKQLVNLQIEKIDKIEKGRAFSKFFATQNLLASVISHYSKENDNLESGKQCLTYLILKMWSWILTKQLDRRPSVKKEFSKLINIHFRMLDSYFKKTLPVALLENGLYAESGGPFEEIGYPLRSFEYLNYLVYFFQARIYAPTFKRMPSETKRRILRRKQKDLLIQLIDSNDGCARPLMDYHSIAILNVFLFFCNKKDMEDKDLQFLGNYILQNVDNITIIKRIRDRFPSLHNNELSLVNVSISKEDSKYEDRSSLLITILFELAAILKFDYIHQNYKKVFEGKINLQTAYPNFSDFDIERLLFEKNFDKEFYVETNLSLGDDLEKFEKSIMGKEYETIEYRTDRAGFPFLRILAHIYYKNEFFVDEWRVLYKEY